MKCIKLNNKNKLENLIFLLFSSLSILLIVYIMKDGIIGNDYWWHIKTGEWIVKNHKIPENDIFSWYGTEKNIHWIPHEWLSGVILFLVFNLCGNNGVFIFVLLMALIFDIMLLFKMKKYVENNLVMGGLFILFFTIIVTMLFYPRPHIFTYFLLFFEFKILYAFIENRNTKLIYLIPVIGILWSNLHGGSAILSYVMCAVVLVAGIFKFENSRILSIKFEKKDFLKLTLIIFLTIIGVLINPVGKDVLIYPFLNQGDSLMISIISEWQSPDIKDIGQLLLYYIPIILMTYGIIVDKKQIHIIDILFTALFVYLFLRSTRFIMFWYICAVFSSMKYMKKIKIKSFNIKFEKILIAFIISIIYIMNIFNFVTILKTLDKTQFIKNDISNEMINFIKDDSPKRLFNDYDFGGQLIYNEIPVFFDSRADLYSQENIMVDGLSLLFLESASKDINYVEVEKKMEQYKFDGIFVKKQRPLYSYMISRPDKYLKIKEDNISGYFYTLQ